MKVIVSSMDLKNAVKALQALQRLSGDSASSKKSADGSTGFKGRMKVIEGKLLLDVSNGGAYVQKAISAQTLREGSVGIDLIEVAKYRLSGNVTIDYDHTVNTVIFSTKKAKYALPADQEAIDLIKNTRPLNSDMPIIAKIPTKVLASAAAYVAIKPGLKVEDMRMQFDFRPPTKKDNVGQIEIVGLDFFSYGRFFRRSPEIKIRNSTKFVLKAISLSTILGSVEGEVIEVGVEKGEETKLVRFKSSDADIFYPTLDFPFWDAEKVYQETTLGVMDCAFTVLRKNIREAISTVNKIALSATEPLLLNIKVSAKQVLMAAQEDSKVAVTKIATTDRVVNGEKEALVYLNQHYLESILNLAPDVSPLRIESWDQKRVIIKVPEGSNGKIEYFMAQSDPDQLEVVEGS